MPTFTLASLSQRILDQLDNNTGEFPQAQVTSVINEGLSRLNVVTGFNQATVTVPGGTVAGQLEYDTPDGIMFPLRCDYNGRQLSPLSLRSLSRRYRNWAEDTTVLGPVSQWARIGIGKFVIHPIDLAGGNDLDVTGIAPAPRLSSPGDPVHLDDQFVDILVDYGKNRLPLKEGGRPFQSASLAYRDMIRKIKTMTCWSEMKFPSYWLIQEQEPAQGRGTGLK